MNATWRTLGTHCRDQDWSRARLLHELQNGLPYRTIPAGHVIDWHHPDVQRSLDVEASTVTLHLGLLEVEGTVAFDRPTIGIEVSPPSPPAVESSARWAADATRRLRDENKIPKGMKKAELARLLESEARKALKAGHLSRTLKASYLENQLGAWGIWPLDTFE